MRIGEMSFGSRWSLGMGILIGCPVNNNRGYPLPLIVEAIEIRVVMGNACQCVGNKGVTGGTDTSWREMRIVYGWKIRKWIHGLGPIHVHGVRSGFGRGTVILLVDQFANGIPSGTTGGSEFFFLGVALRLAEEGAEAIEYGELFGRNALFGESASKGAFRTTEIGGARRALDQRREFAEQVVLAGGARLEGAVLEAETIEFGMSGQPAVAAVGKGEAAEGIAMRIGAFARHAESIAKAHYTYK
jgi:hypothetical protein